MAPAAKKPAFTPTDLGGVRLGARDALQFYLPYVAIALPLALTLRPWLPVWVAFCVVPVVDLVLPDDNKNPTEEDRRQHEEDLAYKLPLWLWLPFSLPVLLQQLRRVSEGEVTGALDLVGLTVSTALVTGGVGITAAHELLHKRTRLERAMAHALLAMSNYGHFFVEHVAGHHKTVATPDDPASDDGSHTVYSFVPRSFVLSYVGAWRHETRRAGGALTLRNRMLWFAAGPAVFFLAVLRFYGRGAAAFFLAQAAVGAIMLEIINLIEHSGLRRAPLPGGGYEPVNVTHSWNAPNRLTNALLFKLQRHSDHHANATRRYHVLRCYEESPQMPTGYAGMMLIALVPPVWRAIMKPLTRRYLKAEDKRAVDYGPAQAKARNFLLAWSATFTALAYTSLGVF